MKRSIPAALLVAASSPRRSRRERRHPGEGLHRGLRGGRVRSLPFEGDYDLGFQLEAGGEYYFSPVFGVRATFGYASAGVDGGSDVTIGGFEASAVYTSRRGDWAPFVLGGFGIHTVDPPGDGPSQRLGAHFGAGTEYYLDRRTALTGQLTGRFIGSAGGRTSSFASVTFGVKYHF